jgi:hypothetical protein
MAALIRVISTRSQKLDAHQGGLRRRHELKSANAFSSDAAQTHLRRRATTGEGSRSLSGGRNLAERSGERQVIGIATKRSISGQLCGVLVVLRTTAERGTFVG